LSVAAAAPHRTGTSSAGASSAAFAAAHAVRAAPRSLAFEMKPTGSGKSDSFKAARGSVSYVELTDLQWRIPRWR